MNEHEHQKIIIAFCQKHEKLSSIFAIPNGGIRDIGTATKLKAEGVKKGVPDLFLALPNESHAGLFIELKTETGRASKEQKEWIARLNENGYRAVVCFGYQEAINEIKTYAGIE
jgi:hypothetical protein